MDDRVLLVEDENRPHLTTLLEVGDPAVSDALIAYRNHVRWAREVHQSGRMPPNEIPTFLRSTSGKEVLSQSRRRLISLGATLMADKVIRVRSQPRMTPMTEIDHVTEMILDRLVPRKLGYKARDAAVLIDLATAYPWLEQLRFALNAARLVINLDHAPEVIKALQRLDSEFTKEPKTLLISKSLSYHPQVRALLTQYEADPSRAVGSDDAYGPAAIALLKASHAHWDSTEALTFLAEPRGTRPAATWWQEAERRSTTGEDFSRLQLDLLDLVAEIDLTGGRAETHGVYRPDVVLLGEINTIVVRGAAWSARFLATPDIVPVLGKVVLRCSSLVRGLWGAVPMNSKVSYAAVDSLIFLDSPIGRSELENLLTEVQAIPVLRRIASSLNVPETEVKGLIKARRPYRLVHRAEDE